MELHSGDREEVPSFFFAPSKIQTEAIECDVETEACILRNIIPIPVRSSMQGGIKAAILQAMDKNSANNTLSSWSADVLLDRNGGFLDNIDPIISRFELRNDAKKGIVENLRLKKDNVKQSTSPYHGLVRQLSQEGMRITGLILEVADTINEVSLSLGAAVMLAKTDSAKQWILKKDNYRELIKAEKSSRECKFCTCYLDELFGLHIATNIPVIISDSLYSRVSVDGLLQKKITKDEMTMSCPYFVTERERNIWNKQLEAIRAKPPKKVPPISAIDDATTFLKMRLSEKRACLRASGYYGLPRPREGPKKVDAMMIPLLDEEVAYEVLRRLGETKGDFVEAAKMQYGESKKPALARAYREAKERGDDQRAKELADEINELATLAYDPSNPDDETSKGKDGFDIKLWYYEARKRISIASGAVY